MQHASTDRRARIKRSGRGTRPLSELLSYLTPEPRRWSVRSCRLAELELRREAMTAAKGSATLVVAAVGGLLTLVFGTSPRRGAWRS